MRLFADLPGAPAYERIRPFPGRAKAVERIENHQLSQDLGWGTFNSEPAARLKSGKRTPSCEAEEHSSRPVTEFDSVGGRWPQVELDRLDSSFQLGPLSRDQSGDRGEYDLCGWVTFFLDRGVPTHLGSDSAVALNEIIHLGHSDAGRINATSKEAIPH